MLFPIPPHPLVVTLVAFPVADRDYIIVVVYPARFQQLVYCWEQGVYGDIKQAGDTRIGMLKKEPQGVGEDMEATRDYFDGFEAIFRQTLNDLNDIHPPAQAQDAHEEFVAALSRMLALAEHFNDRLADLESPSDLEALLAQNEPSFDAAAERFDNACVQLQGIAHENGIEVNLGCE